MPSTSRAEPMVVIMSTIRISHSRRSASPPARLAATGTRIARRPTLSCRAERGRARRRRRRDAPVLYYRDPSGAPVWSATPKSDAAGPRLICRSTTTRSRRSIRPSQQPQAAPGRAQDSLLPQSDGPARHLAGAEEGLRWGWTTSPSTRASDADDGGGHQDQPGPRPAGRRAHRAGRGARDRAAGARGRHGRARRAPRHRS